MEKYAIPVKGKLCRFPGNPKIFLPESGGYVPWTGSKGRYWRRRLKEGSITIKDEKQINNDLFSKKGGKE